MKESKFIKSVTDRQMPDLEAIRNNCLNQPEKKNKAKIITFGGSRLVAVAAVSALALVGMIAAVAMPGGLVFKRPEPQPVITTSDVPTQPETKETASDVRPSGPKPSSSSNGLADENKDNTDEEYKPSTSMERCILRMQDAGYEIDELYDLGKVGDYHLCLAKNGDSTSCPGEYIIGDYVFRTDERYYPYGPALFAVGHEETYTLADAYSMSVLGDDFGKVAELLENAEHVGDFRVTVEANGEKEERFRNLYGNPDTLTLANLGALGEAELCYVVSDTFTGDETEARLGSYTLELNASQAVNPHGLFVVFNDEVFTPEQAKELGVVDDLDEVVELALSRQDVVDFNWNAVRDEPEAEENIEPTETTEETKEEPVE